MDLIGLIKTYQPEPALFQLGIFTVHWYGLLLAVGMVAGYLVTRNIWRRRGWLEQDLDALMVWLVLGGLIGARLLDVFWFEWWYFKNHLPEIFYIWQGGLAWHGALLGGAVVLWWWWRHSPKQSFLFLLDSFAPGLALGQAIGRWGNYFNQELFGLPSNLPWAIPIAVANRPAEFIAATHFHPTFFYEFLGLLMVFYVLWRLVYKQMPAGRLFALYLFMSGLLRLVLEFLRIDEQNIILSGRAGFWLAGLVMVAGICFWHNQSWPRKKENT